MTNLCRNGLADSDSPRSLRVPLANVKNLRSSIAAALSSEFTAVAGPSCTGNGCQGGLESGAARRRETHPQCSDTSDTFSSVGRINFQTDNSQKGLSWAEGMVKNPSDVSETDYSDAGGAFLLRSCNPFHPLCDLP
jgi:hypothetical protein